MLSFCNQKRWRKQLCQVPFLVFDTICEWLHNTNDLMWLQLLYALHLVFFLPVPFKLPKLFDLSEWELLLASPADPDFALFPFSKNQIRGNNTSRSGPVYSTYQHIWWNKDKHRQSLDKTTPPQTVPICVSFPGLEWRSVRCLPSLDTCQSSKATVKAWATVSATAWAWRTGEKDTNRGWKTEH